MLLLLIIHSGYIHQEYQLPVSCYEEEHNTYYKRLPIKYISKEIKHAPLDALGGMFTLSSHFENITNNIA